MKINRLMVDKLIAERGMTYTDVARKIGITCGSLSQNLRGNAHHTTVARTAKALGVPVEDIMSYD
jgi:transcriptional regulator with XRE-family HTH domain